MDDEDQQARLAGEAYGREAPPLLAQLVKRQARLARFGLDNSSPRRAKISPPSPRTRLGRGCRRLPASCAHYPRL